MRHKFLGFIHMNSVELTKVEVNANFELLERTTEAHSFKPCFYEPPVKMVLYIELHHGCKKPSLTKRVWLIHGCLQ